jgi:hypothetical protein
VLRTITLLARATLGCLFLTAITGCGAPDNNATLAEINSTNIQRLANLYFTYQTQNEWRGPADEPAFKSFIQNFDPEKLKRINVDPAAADQLFISERDGQPFKIRYGVKGSAMGSSESVIFEATGVDGKRMVGFLNMQQQEVDDQQYNSFWQGAAAPTAPSRPQ